MSAFRKGASLRPIGMALTIVLMQLLALLLA
jgi:hypothetical protein